MRTVFIYHASFCKGLYNERLTVRSFGEGWGLFLRRPGKGEQCNTLPARGFCMRHIPDNMATGEKAVVSFSTCICSPLPGLRKNSPHPSPKLRTVTK
jgi:hypothetical protein